MWILASSTASQDTDHFSADEEFCIIDDPGLGIVVSVHVITVNRVNTVIRIDLYLH